MAFLETTGFKRTPVFMLLLVGTFVLLQSGCLEALPEGLYSCSEEGADSNCPDGWYCRTGDGGMNQMRCYSTPGRESGIRFGSTDSGTEIIGDDDDDSGIEDEPSDGSTQNVSVDAAVDSAIEDEPSDGSAQNRSVDAAMDSN